jgi:hypothetical protein
MTRHPRCASCGFFSVMLSFLPQLPLQLLLLLAALAACYLIELCHHLADEITFPPYPDHPSHFPAVLFHHA